MKRRTFVATLAASAAALVEPLLPRLRAEPLDAVDVRVFDFGVQYLPPRELSPEDLSTVIYEVRPYETPFLTKRGRS